MAPQQEIGQSAKNVVAGGGGGGLVERVLAEHPGMFGDVVENADRYRFQVLLSRVQQDEQGKPYLVRDGFRVDREYFYPASAVKLCAIVAVMLKLRSLEKLMGVQIPCISPLSFYPLLEGGAEEQVDLSNLDGKRISVSHEVRKILLVSDNIAFNQLYALVGHRTLNETMWNLGLKSLRLHHRVSVNLSLEENKICEPVELDVGGIKATLAPKRSRLLVPDNSMLRGVKVGAAHVTPSGELVLEPMDFSKKNYISLMDLQDLLIKIVRKDVELNAAPITISEDMRMMLTTAMSQYPSESSNPKYDKSDFPDDYCKFFLPGLARVRRKGALRIFNKIGRAYGFSVDNSYVFDVETGQNFFLSAVIYTNANEIVNNDKYEYDFADTVMADLAEVIARAVWQVPSYVSSKSCPTDCIPSSLLDPCDPPLVQPIVSKAIEVSLQTTSGKQPQLDLQPLPIFGSKIVDCASKNAGIKGASFSLMTDSPGEYESKEENDVRSDIPSSSDSANGLMQIEASIAPHSTTGRKMFADAPEGALDTSAPAQMRSVHNSHDASCDLRAHVTTIWPSCPLNNSDICSIKQNTSEYHLQDVTSSSLGVDLAHYQQKTQIKAQKDSLVDKTYFYFVDQ